MASVTSLIKVTFSIDDLFEIAKPGFESQHHDHLKAHLAAEFPNGLTIPITFTLGGPAPTIH